MDGPIRRNKAMNGMVAGLVLGLALSASPAGAQPADASAPRPPNNIRVSDAPDDSGKSLVIVWDPSPDDTAQTIPRRVMSYEIRRRVFEEMGFKKVGEAVYGTTSFEDSGCELGVTYLYQIVAVSPEGVSSEPAESPTPVATVRQWINTTKIWFGVILLLVCGSVVYFIEVARGGRSLNMRRIAGLEAVEEAVGRATELGRPVLFVTGIQDINDIQTIAGITVLSNVARKCAEYDAKIEVPTCRSLVMTTARETVQAAFLAAGRPDAYREDRIYYLTDEQFGFVAGVTGMMVRERPAACFYMGAFYAESLFLAETGNAIGAIQVAGTAMTSQLPFFVAACDYTLIGEEFFAASAYLSGEPHQLGSLKGQDLGKFVGAVLLVLGCLAGTLHAVAPETLGFAKATEATFEYIKNNVLGDSGILP